MSYLCDPFFILIFIFIMINRIISSIQRRLFFYSFFFFKYFLLFLHGTWMKNVNNFQITKDQSQGVAWHLLDFLPISVWRFL